MNTRARFDSLSLRCKLCIGSELIFGLCEGAWSISLNFYLTARGIDGADIGVLLCIGYLVTAVMSFLVGRLGDHKGYPFVVGLGGSIMCCGLLMVVLGIQPVWYYVGHMVYCVGLACVMAMEFNLPLSLAPNHRKQSCYNLVLVFYFFGSFVGNFLCQIFFKHVPSNASAYQLILGICAGLHLFLAIFRGNMPRTAVQETKSVVFGNVWHDLWKQKVYVYLLYGFLTFGLLTLSTGMLNLVLRQWKALPDHTVGTVYAMNSIISCLILLLLPTMIRRFRLHGISSVIMVLQMLAFAVATFAGNRLFVMMLFVRSACCSILYTSVDAPMLQSITENKRGTYAGMRVFANYIGMATASILSGWLVEKSLFALLFGICALVALAQNLTYQILCYPKVKYQFANQ